MDGILESVKKLLGIGLDYDYFDADLILHINSVFSILAQLGVGDQGGFMITGSDEMWSDFLPEENTLETVKSYMGQKVKLLFDPPLSSSVMEAMNRMIAEMEWRIRVQADELKKQEESYDG